MTRDQRRALHAYARVENVASEHRADYKVAVHGLCTTTLRSGLAVSMAYLERSNRAAASTLLNDLAGFGLPGVRARSGSELPAAVRGLSLMDYMLVTRETLKLATWFKRAVQARFGDEQPTDGN